MSTKPPANDHDYLAFVKHYLEVATSKQKETGLSDSDIAELRTLVQLFTEKLETSNAQKVKSSAAVKEKDDTKTQLSGKVRRLSSKVNGEESVTDYTRMELGLSVRGVGRTTISPTTPYDLVANLLTDGSVELYWNKALNPDRTQYLLEMQTPQTAPEWSVVDVLLTGSFLHKNPPDVTAITYRVSARRRKDLSPPSNTAVVTLRKAAVS